MNCLLLYIFLVLRRYILDLVHVELERQMDAVFLLLIDNGVLHILFYFEKKDITDDRLVIRKGLPPSDLIVTSLSFVFCFRNLPCTCVY